MNNLTEKFLELLDKAADEIIENEEFLTDLDRKIGDSDHGINMKRGFGEIKKMLPEYKELEVSEILTKCAMTLMTKVGGASGPLYGTAFMKAGTALKGKDENEILNNSVLCNALNEAVTGIKERGKAEHYLGSGYCVPMARNERKKLFVIVKE